MPKTKLQKGEILRDLKEKISRSKAVVFAKFEKMTVNESESLRKELRKENGEYYVAKKTLIGLAFKDAGMEIETKKFDGQTAVVFGYEDEVMPAKLVGKYKKELKEKIGFFGGILESRFINAAEVENLSSLPGKTELYAKLVGTLNAPVSGFVNALAGNIRNFVQVLKAIEEKKV